MSKANRTQTYNKLNELIGSFTQLHKREHLNKMKTREKDKVARTIESQEHMNADHIEAIRQSSNRTEDKLEHNKQMHNYENYTMMSLGCISRKLERLCYY